MILERFFAARQGCDGALTRGIETALRRGFTGGSQPACAYAVAPPVFLANFDNLPGLTPITVGIGHRFLHIFFRSEAAEK